MIPIFLEVPKYPKISAPQPTLADRHSVLQLEAGFPCTLKYWTSSRDRKGGSSPRYSPSFASSQMSSTSEGKERKEKLGKEMKTEAKMLPSESRLTGISYFPLPSVLFLCKVIQKTCYFFKLGYKYKTGMSFLYYKNGKQTLITNI